MQSKIIVTGASGVLGSAVYAAFRRAGNHVLGLAHSRSTGELVKLDLLLDREGVERVFGEFGPDWVIHCAAERRPDVAEKKPEETQKLNALVPAHLSSLALRQKFRLVYISTDYVFDGTAPPYAPSAVPNPVNLYGRTKRDGEVEVLQRRAEGAEAIVLRVPVLYGPAPKNSDTAINALIDVVQDQSGKEYKMDHYSTRYPTNVLDIAKFLVRLTGIRTPLPPILHFSSPEPFTKYEICLVFAQLLHLPHAHIVPDAEPPTGAAAASRPRDCKLDCSLTESLLAVPPGGGGAGGAGVGAGVGVGVGGGPAGLTGVSGGLLDCCIFEEWWRGYFEEKEKEKEKQE